MGELLYLFLIGNGIASSSGGGATADIVPIAPSSAGSCPFMSCLQCPAYQLPGELLSMEAPAFRPCASC
jgi:hypothetical protein